MDTKQVKRIADVEADKAVKGHESSMHGTKKMKKGGVTSMDMKTMGRNMARVMNQRSGGRGR
jgi:hypothetical protein